MTRVDRLKRDARAACERRGHDMGRFSGGPVWYGRSNRLPSYYVANCRNCDAQVAVTPRPMPNEIDIGGEAVATECRPGTTYAEREAALAAITRRDG